MLKYLKKYWFFALLAPVFMIGEVSMDLLQPELMSRIIDDGVLGLNNGGVGNLNTVITIGLKMIGFVALGGICGIMSGVFANLCAQQFGNDVRKAVFKRIMEFSFEQTDKFSTGSLITRVTNDITQLQNFVMQCLRGFVRTSMLFIGGIACMVSLNMEFGIIIACALPQKLNAKIIFGFEDPYYTGKVLGWTAALIPIYGDHINITPDFEKRILKGELKIKGRIRRYKILYLLWKVYKDKDELIKQKDRAIRMIGGS